MSITDTEQQLISNLANTKVKPPSRWPGILLVVFIVVALFVVVLSYQHQILGNQATIRSQGTVLLTNQVSGRALIKYEINLGRISIKNQALLGARAGVKTLTAPKPPNVTSVQMFPQNTFKK